MESKKKVLVLEDKPSRQVRLRMYLEVWKELELCLASSLEEANELFDRHEGQFELIAVKAILPRQEGSSPTLAGPFFANRVRQAGYSGLLVAVSDDPKELELLREKGCDEETDEVGLPFYLLGWLGEVIPN